MSWRIELQLFYFNIKWTDANIVLRVLKPENTGLRDCIGMNEAFDGGVDEFRTDDNKTDIMNI